MFRPFHVVVVVLIALSITEVASAREKTGLVLSGGGARGFAHVAVLEALEANQVQIDYIAGTSMGAVVGALYASGLSADQVREKLNSKKPELYYDALKKLSTHEIDLNNNAVLAN